MMYLALGYAAASVILGGYLLISLVQLRQR